MGESAPPDHQCTISVLPNMTYLTEGKGISMNDKGEIAEAAKPGRDELEALRFHAMDIIYFMVVHKEEGGCKGCR